MICVLLQPTITFQTWLGPANWRSEYHLKVGARCGFPTFAAWGGRIASCMCVCFGVKREIDRVMVQK